MIEAVICFALFQCDPYVKISLGRKTHDDRDNYKPNTLNPELGRLDYIVPSYKSDMFKFFKFILYSRYCV